jgi:isoaspartyl peptidase/L-asparaginase-like protein (Ntn-hydrolase superfamily)
MCGAVCLTQFSSLWQHDFGVCAESNDSGLPHQNTHKRAPRSHRLSVDKTVPMKKFFLRSFEREQGLDEAARDLRAGKNRDDVLERAVRTLELDPSDDSLGFGGYPNLFGAMELDASFMDGNNRNCGAVIGMTNFLPVSVARRLMQQEVHAVLQGHGAELFARESGLPTEPTLSADQREKWQRDIKPLLDTRGSKSLMEIVTQLPSPQNRNLDTTVMIASDGSGLSGAASTSGWPYKHPGRVGDTPIIGAGLYVDSRYGGCCCTFTGEMAIRTGTSRHVVANMAQGKSPRDAVQAAIEDVSRLRSGILRTFVTHAIDPDGSAHVAAINASTPIYYQYWNEDLAKPERREAEMVRLSSSALSGLASS